MPAQMPAINQAMPRKEINLEEIFRKLPRRAGTGVSGMRNEYLTALLGDHGEETANRVIQAYDTFATEKTRRCQWCSLYVDPSMQQLLVNSELQSSDPHMFFSMVLGSQNLGSGAGRLDYWETIPYTRYSC